MTPEFSRNGIVHINLSAMAENYQRVADIAGTSRCGAVVKADAYGLGAAAVARRLQQEGCGDFFVADLAEAVRLRQVVSGARLFVLDGPQPHSIQAYQNHQLTPVINTVAQLEEWKSRGPKVPAALHVDTGMTRLGINIDTIVKLHRSGALDKLDLCLLMTHLACADEPDSVHNSTQLKRFSQVTPLFPGVDTSVGNSAATLLGWSGNLARLGIVLFGGNPVPGKSLSLQEVVHVQGRILQRQRVSSGMSVGYGATFTTQRDSLLMTVGIGYADGYLRSLGGRGYACIDGHRAPVVGRISMDSLVVDATDLPNDCVNEAEWVSLLGGGVDMDELAQLAGTISYELLTRLGHRVLRQYHD